MRYEERLFRSWATKNAQKREEDQPVTEHRRRCRFAGAEPETTLRNEVKRNLEEIV
jgi:hypothetical protein